MVAIDFVNAFSSVDRNRVEIAVLKYRPDIIGVFRALYGGKEIIVLGNHLGLRFFRFFRFYFSFYFVVFEEFFSEKYFISLSHVCSFFQTAAIIFAFLYLTSLSK